MENDENYQLNYGKLLNFLTKRGSGSFIFAIADDIRYIKHINQTLIADLKSKYDINAKDILLQFTSDEPVLHQMKETAPNGGALLINNLYEVASDSEIGQNILLHLNFSREELKNLPSKVVFWINKATVTLLANFAADLYAQRSFSTVHFTGEMKGIKNELPQEKDWETFTSTENFADIEAKIATLKRRLQDAEEAGYPKERIANEIALPLAENYALIGFRSQASSLLDNYLGAIDRNNAISLEKLVNIYKNLNQLANAITNQRMLIDLQKVHFGNEHKEIARTYNDIALLAREAGDYRRAKRWMKVSIRICEKLYDVQHPELGIRYSNLSLIAQDLGDIEEAKEWIQKAIFIGEMTYDADHPSLAIRYSNLALILQDLGEVDQAKIWMQKAIIIDEKIYEMYHPSLAIRYSNMAVIEKSLGDFSSAKEWMKKAIAIDEKIFEPTHSTLAIRYSNMAIIERGLGNVDSAKHWMEMAMAIDEKTYEANHPTLAISFSNMAVIEQDLGNLVEAKKWMRKAIAIDQAAYSSKHPTLIVRYSNMAMIEHDLGNLENAKGWMMKANFIAKKYHKQNHPDMVTLQENIALIENLIENRHSI